ncbi:hypothetical protein [Hirschia baltica]|uniref:Lipoprotein n=1 Tax=Hirschia baltica (strain ATCC 49814 / DSM 5838 / IFAM 1418) TaxID=582402 RepID=C6XRQ0_HIRBI|nr:hypothetical protein [Hirschia baltica]ACT60660.1 hypothetical protein Hbal_2992 [Hirschia baltica ATCC 49814]
MKRFIALSALFLSVFTFACSAPPEDSYPSETQEDFPPPPPPPPPPVLPEPDEDMGMEASSDDEVALDEVASLEVVTDFLRADEGFLPKEGELPVGLVLFDKSEELKNAVLCDAYTKELRTHAEAKADAPDQDFFVTYWLLKDEPGNFSSCDALRDAYDYERAEKIKSDYGLEDTKGPVFLAVDANGDSVFLDLSDADMAATRAAVDQWLILALESSDDTEEMVNEEAFAEAEVGQVTQSRFSLASFSVKVKSKLLTMETTDLLEETQVKDRKLFAYNDPDTGYRLGSTLRF